MLMVLVAAGVFVPMLIILSVLVWKLKRNRINSNGSGKRESCSSQTNYPLEALNQRSLKTKDATATGEGEERYSTRSRVGVQSQVQQDENHIYQRLLSKWRRSRLSSLATVHENSDIEDDYDDLGSPTPCYTRAYANYGQGN